MSLLDNLSKDESIGGEETDNLGGRRLLESGAYLFTIKLAYLLKSKGGATGLFLHLEGQNGEELRQAMYITNKAGQNYYTKDGQKNYLPGYNMANSLALLTTGKELAALGPDVETKTINVYSSDAKAEVPTKVEMIMPLLNASIYAGVLKQIVDKTTLVGSDYVPTGETREENEIDKFFCAREGYEKLTSAEIRAGNKEPGFFNDWLKKWEGQTRNKAKGAAAGGTAGAPSRPGATPSAKPSESLFGDS